MKVCRYRLKHDDLHDQTKQNGKEGNGRSFKGTNKKKKKKGKLMYLF
jgi:hypothetical protein